MSKPAARTPRSHPTELSGPGSLIQRPTANQERCRHCGSYRLTSITMTLTDGSPVDFTSCHTCERRWWVQGGVVIEFEHVIEKTRKIA